MACHGGGNNRLDDQLAEPGFPDIDDPVMGSPVRVERCGGRGPRHLGWWREMPIPLSPREPMLLPLSTRAGPSLSLPRNDSPPAKRLPRFRERAAAFPSCPPIPEPAATPNNEVTGCQPNKPSARLPTLPPHRDLPEAAPTRVSCSTCSPSVAPPWAGLTVGGFFFVIAAAAFLSDRAGYGAALSVYGTVITLLPVSIVWAVLRWTRARLGPDSADMTGIATSWDKHWVGVTWWTAAMATGWIVIAVLVAGLPDLMSLGSRGGFPALFELLSAGLAALGACLYVAIAATAVLVIIVPVSAGPVRQEPTRGLAQATFTLFFRGGDTAHRGRGRQDGRQPGPCAGNQLTPRRDTAGLQVHLCGSVGSQHDGINRQGRLRHPGPRRIIREAVLHQHHSAGCRITRHSTGPGEPFRKGLGERP